MGFFSSRKQSLVRMLTQQSFVRKRLHTKMRAVLPRGTRGEKKIHTVDTALGIESSSYSRNPRLKKSLQEDEVEDAIDRLTQKNLLSQSESERIQDILDEGMHPGGR